jgi:PilZ domain-containing protein
VEERREHVREQADWLADIYADDTIYTSPVRNLSLGGIEIMRPPLWKPKARHFCRISLSDMIPSHTLEVRTEICWISEKAVGLKYHELKFKEKIKLNKIISGLSRAMTTDSAHYVM